MDAETINLWLDQAERDEVISSGFRPQVERKLLELMADRDKWKDYCDPSPSPDPVVGRLEGELSESAEMVKMLRVELGHMTADKRELLETVKGLKQQLHAVGDGDTWKAACQRVEAELERAREDTLKLLERCKLAVLNADSELSAYGHGRPLERDVALDVSGRCRQVYKEIVAWMIQTGGR